MREQVALALSGGGDSPYDILHGANGQIADWGAPGWVMPLNDLIEKYWDEYDLGDIPQGYWDSATYNGNIYGVPVVGNTLHLVYRSDVFEEMGWAPCLIPTTSSSRSATRWAWAIRIGS